MWDLNTGGSVEFVGTDSLLELASSGHYVTTGISVTTLVAVPHVIYFGCFADADGVCCLSRLAL